MMPAKGNMPMFGDCPNFSPSHFISKLVEFFKLSDEPAKLLNNRTNENLS